MTFKVKVTHVEPSVCVVRLRILGNLKPFLIRLVFAVTVSWFFGLFLRGLLNGLMIIVGLADSFVHSVLSTVVQIGLLALFSVFAFKDFWTFRSSVKINGKKRVLTRSDSLIAYADNIEKVLLIRTTKGRGRYEQTYYDIALALQGGDATVIARITDYNSALYASDTVADLLEKSLHISRSKASIWSFNK